MNIIIGNTDTISLLTQWGMCFKFLLSVPIHRFYPWLHINITWGAFKNSGFPIGPWTKYIMILDPQILRSQHFLKRFQCSNGWKSLLYLICFLWFKFSCRVSLMRLVLLRCLVIYQIIPICSSLPFRCLALLDYEIYLRVEHSNYSWPFHYSKFSVILVEG